MKLSQLKQQIEELDAKAESKYLDEQLSAMRKLSDTWCNVGPELLRRLLVAEEALNVIYGAADDSEGPSDDPIAQAYNVALNVIIAEVESALATIRGEKP